MLVVGSQRHAVTLIDRVDEVAGGVRGARLRLAAAYEAEAELSGLPMDVRNGT